MQLARADGTSQRFYSMSAQRLKEKATYCKMLEQTQKGDLNITCWLSWFLDCLFNAMDHTEKTIAAVLNRTQFWGKNRKVASNGRQQ